MALDFVAPLATWLAATPLSALIGEVAWIVPAVQSLHILAISVVVAGVFLIDLRLLGAFGESDGIAAYTRRYLPWVWWALAVLLVTGAIMIVSEPVRALRNTTFVVKMVLIVVAVTLTGATQRPLKADPDFWRDHKTRARALALASLTVWVAVIACGRWIAYTQDPGA